MDKNRLKEIIKNIVTEESEYQVFFQKALEKAGKSIPSMSDEEKKAFFNKIDAAWDARGEKNEELHGNQHKLDVDGDGEIEASDLAKLRAKKDESINEADVKKKINRRGDVDGLIVTHEGNDYEIVYSSDFSMGGAVQPYGIVMPGDDVVSFLGKDKKAKSIWKQLKPKVDKFVKSNESVNEEIKIGSSVVVNYPNLKKPIHGKVKYTAKAPTGMVYILDGDKGVWDGKYVSLKETVKEEDDLDIGHTDDEPNMLKSTALELAQYAAKLVKKLDTYDKMPQEVDFPNWWQAKLILAKDYVQAAHHYLDSKETLGEGRAFVSAAKKAKEEGKTEFEFNGKKYPVTIKD